MTKTYIIYHKNCLDGFGSAYIAHKFLSHNKVSKEIEMIPAAYGDPLPIIEDGSIVFILDFSYPRDVLIELDKRPITLLVIDHHKTAAEDLIYLPFAIFDMNKSGAMLTWEHFYKHKERHPPEIIEYIQDNDLWLHKLPKSKEIIAGLRSYPFDVNVWGGLTIDRLEREGEAIVRFKNRQIDELVEEARLVTLDLFFPFLDDDIFTEEERFIEFPILNVSCASIISETNHRLLEIYSDVPFSMTYFDKRGKTVYSLRSLGDDFDVSKLAKKFGGGGHPKAAGFTL